MLNCHSNAMPQRENIHETLKRPRMVQLKMKNRSANAITHVFNYIFTRKEEKPNKQSINPQSDRKREETTSIR
jgi:hypothetical protein